MLNGVAAEGDPLCKSPTCNGTPATCQVQCRVRSAIGQRLRRAHDEFEAYQRRLPFRTVVPEPPHLLHEHLAALVVSTARCIFWAAFLLFTFPLWAALHLLLVLMDRRQRADWLGFQRSWPYHSVPHVRPVRYTADPAFPLEGWRLRCEDGRQRWFFGEPLATAEAGNEMGAAQVLGCDTVAAYRRVSHPSRCSSPRHAVGDGWKAAGEDGTRSMSERGKDRALLKRKIQHRAYLEKYELGLCPTSPRRPRPTSEDAMRDGLAFLLRLQDPFSGHWPNDYSGCMFLLPGLIFTKFIIAEGDRQRMFPPFPDHVHVARTETNVAGLQNTYIGEDYAADGAATPAKQGRKTELPVPCRCGDAMRHEIIRYLRNYQNDDGGWGQHTEGHSTMLGTVLNYVSMRMLGVAASDPQLTVARAWIRNEGGAVRIPMWGKMWLCIVGLFHYDGVIPLPPEMILLPDWVPFSLGRAWCHSRVIAIPFSYFYGLRWSMPRTALLDAVKEEIYMQPFDSIPWQKVRHEVCPRDLYTPTTRLFRVACALLSLYERHHVGYLRRYALEVNWRHMAYDDENTHFICLGPVNKSLNMLVTWLREGEQSVRYRMHADRVADYLFMGPTGMRMSGYNGSQLWDTSFAIQAVCACRGEMLYPDEMRLAQHYIDIAQVQMDPIAAPLFYRHRTAGSWNFSTRDQGWQVSDCTAEGLRAVLLLQHIPFPTHRIYEAVDEILSLRNSSGDGGWASYEPARGPAYCELMSCAEMFKDVMVEYSYAECSSSCLHTLALFRARFPTYRRRDVDVAISEGIACVLGKQRSDGSFYGSWAVCFTYAAWIVADALQVSRELGDMANHPHCVRLVNFLVDHQNADGGWGEDINACVRQVWVDNPDGSQVVNTAWAMMAVMFASGEGRRTSLPRRKRISEVVQRGANFIMSRQLETGDWAQERISGVFNGNNPIHYPGYKNSMTVWALGVYNEWKTTYPSTEEL